MNKTHYTEADLLETYYMQPGASMPVMMHLADCNECAARYERLERKLRQAAACDSATIDDKPETFWARQRLMVLRRIEEGKARHGSVARSMRIAASAVLAFFLGGAVVYKTLQPAPQPERVVVVSTAAAPAPPPADISAVSDPWQSEDLRDFHGVVAWESWGDAAKPGDPL